MALSLTAILAPPLLTALAGVGSLYALHHLRAKPRRRVVETLLFWDRADVEASARLLRARRPRQWMAFLLLSLIVLLLAFALSIIRLERSRQPVAAIVVDAGDSAADERGRALLPALRDAASSALAGHHAVLIAAAEQPRIVADANEPSAIGWRRLADLLPSRTAPASAQSLELAASLLGSGEGPIDWFTTQASIPDDVPPAIAHRVRRHWVSPADYRWAITAIQFNASPDDPASGSLTVDAAGSTTSSSATIRVAWDSGEPRTEDAIRVADRSFEAVFPDLRASGQTIHVAIIDGRRHEVVGGTDFTLPRESLPRFVGMENAPAAMRAALLSIGTETDQSDGAIAVLMPGMPVPPGAVGAIEIVPGDKSGGRVRLASEDAMLTRGLGFEGALAAADAAGMPGEKVVLRAGDQPVITLSSSGERAIIYVRASAVSADAALPRLPAFPMLFRRLCHLLSGSKAGSTVVVSQRHVDDPLWAGSDQDRLCMVGSLTDKTSESVSDASVPRQPWDAKWDAAEWALCVCVALILLDAAMLRGGKIV